MRGAFATCDIGEAPGVAVLDQHAGDLGALFDAADAALYAAKTAGRNRLAIPPAP
jgi:GGDEF domain-containing protein